MHIIDGVAVCLFVFSKCKTMVEVTGWHVITMGRWCGLLIKLAKAYNVSVLQCKLFIC